MAYKRSVNTANDPNMGPIFRFTTYESANAPFYNNSSRIDFVTKDGDLYVCVEDGVSYKPGSPSNNGFLMLVQRGKDGRPGAPGAPGAPGPAPEYTLKFDGKQLIIIDQNGVRKAASPELTGPAWFPELQGHTIIWRRKEADDAAVPQNINLDELRPVEERPVLFRCNSDNTKRSDEESGPGYYIQWKREGNDEWTNLMSISELMNIALAGVCFWWADDENGATDIEGNPIQRLHFGHKQVVKATYDSAKIGNRKIADVELGDVLFDAGEIPFANYDDAIAALTAYLNDLQEDLGVVRASVPTRVSQLENDVPYIKSINNNRPNSNGEIKVKTIDGADIVGESGNIPFATINGRKISNTDENFVIPTNYLVANNVKTLGGNSLIKGSDVDIDLPVRTVDGEHIFGFGNIDVVDDIEFRVDNNILQYRTSVNGTWGNWANIALPSGQGGQNEHVELKIENNVLKIKYNSGSWQDVGSVAGGSGSGDTVNGLVGVSKSGNDLVFTKQDGTTVTITLPEGGTCDLSNYYTKTEIDAMITGGGDDPIIIHGEDAIVLDLSNEIDTIPVDKDGNTQASASFLTELFVFSGSNSEVAFTAQDVTIDIDPNVQGISVVKNFNNDPHAFQINVNSNITLASAVKISFNLWENDVTKTTRTAVYTLVPLQISQSEMFYLEVDPDIIKVDSSGNYTSETVSVLPHWLLDGDPQTITGWNDSSKINDSTVKYHVYYKIDNGQYTFYTNAVNITSAENEVTFELRYYYNNNKVDYIVMDGPEHVLIVRDGDPADAVSVQGQVRYYKAASEVTGITAPATNLDPTLPANGGWSTSANTIQVTEQLPYLWFFERITYSNGNVWQSVPVIVRYRNAAAEVDYQEIISNVETAIQGDLDALDSRLDDIEDSYAITTIDSENALISAVTGYVDGNNKSFADIIVDGKEVIIKNWAGSAVADGLGRQSLTAVKNELDGIDGRITTAATNARNGAVSDARTEWSAADATITNTVDKATYVWVNNTDGSIVAYNGESSKTGYTKKLVSQAMSTIQVQSNKIWAAVGDGNNVAAAISILADAQTSGGKIQLDANNIILNGDVVAGAISTAQLDASQIVSGTINSDRINTNTLTVKNINCDTINGEPTTIKIVFGDANSLQNPQSNTLYFLW